MAPEFHHRNMNSNSNSTEFYNQASSNSISKCCNVQCKGCWTADDAKVQHDFEWIDKDDPCLQHVCRNGIISNLTSLCMGLPCPVESHLFTPGECCPTCDSSWASFCPGDEECDIVCQYGFNIDKKRNCDLCKCARKIIETTSTTAATSDEIDDVNHRNRFNSFFDPTDGATRNLFLGLAVACGVLLVVCLSGIAWYYHRKVYKRVPLMHLSEPSSA